MHGTNCGAENADSSAFCVSCGEPMTAPKRPGFDIHQLLVGDWSGPLLTALATLATAFGLSVLILALMHPDGTSVTGFLALATMVTASAFGGDFTVATHNSGDTHTFFDSHGAYPLTITAAALIVAGLLFSRQLRRYPDWTGSVLHAVRTAIVFAAGLVAITAIFRAHLAPRQFLAPGVAPGYLVLNMPGDYHSDVASTAILGAIWMLLTAAVVILLRDQTLPATVMRLRDWIALPLKSIGVLFAAATLTGLVGALVIYATHDAARNTSAVAVWISALPDLGFTIIYLGAGAAFHLTGRSSGVDLDVVHSYHLTDITAIYTHGLWFAPAATLLALTASAVYVARRSAAATIPVDLLRWLGGLILATPVLVHLSTLHDTLTYPDRKPELDYHYALGIDPRQAIGLIAVWGFVIGLVTVGIVRARPAARAAVAPQTSQPPPPSHEQTVAHP